MNAIPLSARCRERPRGRRQARNVRGAEQTHEACIRDTAEASDDRDDCSPADDAASLAAGEKRGRAG